MAEFLLMCGIAYAIIHFFYDDEDYEYDDEEEEHDRQPQEKMRDVDTQREMIRNRNRDRRM